MEDDNDNKIKLNLNDLGYQVSQHSSEQISDSYIGNSNRKQLIQEPIVESQQDQQKQEIQQGQIVSRDQQIYDSSNSQEDQARLQQEKKKRQDFWRNRAKIVKTDQVVGEEQMLAYAYQAAKATNKRALMLRKKNQSRIEQLQKIRMAQQNYLVGSNTHFRGNPNQYSLITSDRRGKQYLHPNLSLKVSQLQLNQFIRKNIAEQSTANYLNEVVKFQNYAYQQRKKRKQNLQ